MSCVRASVVVLTNFPTAVHCGKHVWCQNLISVSSGAKVAWDAHQSIDIRSCTSKEYFVCIIYMQLVNVQLLAHVPFHNTNRIENTSS